MDCVVQRRVLNSSKSANSVVVVVDIGHWVVKIKRRAAIFLKICEPQMIYFRYYYLLISIV
jgi:hypothetical protein